MRQSQEERGLSKRATPSVSALRAPYGSMGRSSACRNGYCLLFSAHEALNRSHARAQEAGFNGYENGELLLDHSNFGLPFSRPLVG